MERRANKADPEWSDSRYYNSAEGDMAETLDHIQEITHEALIRYDEKKKQEKLDKERER